MVLLRRAKRVSWVDGFLDYGGTSWRLRGGGGFQDFKDFKNE
jgi:hypothetical protein